MTITLDKLRALKRQSGRVAPPPTTALADWTDVLLKREHVLDALPVQSTRATKVSDLGPVLARAQPNGPAPAAAQTIESLRRLLGVRGRALAVVSREPAECAGAAIDRGLPGTEIAPGLRLIESRVPMPQPPLSWPLEFAKRDDGVDPRHLLFFDTETTGLAGGTGTRAFMIGAADFQRDVAHDTLRVRQLLITIMAAEPAMLTTFADWLSPATVLSSYNGRCYDAPLLRTRYRLARLHDPLFALDHVDLLFPSRRRWRGRWENCRLATIEREALGVVRADDLPGAQAPAAWLRYLRGGSAAPLRRVLAHNHQDVVTLAMLMARLVELHGTDSAVD